MSGLILSVGDDPPREWTASALSGYHRPLSGEAANLTLTLELTLDERSAWSVPPLGESALVLYDGETILEGVLTGVAWTPAEISVAVEG